MARLYYEHCIYCEQRTTWVHHDLEPGRSDHCTKCHMTIWQQAKAIRERAAKKKASR